MVIALAGVAQTAIAQPGSAVAPGDEIMPPPPTYKANGVTVEEHLGASLPLDARFRAQDGRFVTLGDVLHGELPTILTFNYADCPMLCSQMLNGLTAAMPEAAKPGAPPAGAFNRDSVVFRLGEQYRIVTISLEPSETLDKATKMRERYIERLPEDQRAAARAGWTFLVADIPGNDAAIRRVAEVVGFKYVYISERAEWAHPAAFIFASSKGVVTRYVYGITVEPEVLRESIFKAGTAEPATAVGFMLRCYHYDPDANNHSHAAVLALRYGAAGFVVLLIAGFGLLIRRSSRSREPRGEVS
jgi:protein SCO1/2